MLDDLKYNLFKFTKWNNNVSRETNLSRKLLLSMVFLTFKYSKMYN
jgi:hypothetical protein